MPVWLSALGDGVHAIDTGFHRDRFDAAYLIVRQGRAAFVDTGTNFALPRLLGALEALGLARDAVDWVIPTHVHLDHAGGVGALMRELPAARVWVHPRGARHLIDPSALYQGALAVYGPDDMARNYGELVPVAAERVVSSADGGTVELGGCTLTAIDTPGHARHHHCIFDSLTRGWFTGDTFGLSYPEFDTSQGPWMLPTSTPVQFEPGPFRASVERLVSWQPECVYLTHFGRHGKVAALAAALLEITHRMVEIGLAHRTAADRHQRIKAAMTELFVGRIAAHGCTLPRDRVVELLAIDLELNTQGLGVWLDRDDKPRG